MKKFLFLNFLYVLLFGTHIVLGQANFTATPKQGCSPLSVTFTALSGSTWNWDLGNGNTFSGSAIATTIYTNPGKYVVKLTINKGQPGESSKSDTITVFKNPTASFTAS